MSDSTPMTMRWLLSMFAADVDIFLLRDETQEKDNDREFFTSEEIREQLAQTVSKMSEMLGYFGYDVDAPLMPPKRKRR